MKTVKITLNVDEEGLDNLRGYIPDFASQPWAIIKVEVGGRYDQRFGTMLMRMLVKPPLEIDGELVENALTVEPRALEAP